jgi:hypothetical protein
VQSAENQMLFIIIKILYFLIDSKRKVVSSETIREALVFYKSIFFFIFMYYYFFNNNKLKFKFVPRFYRAFSIFEKTQTFFDQLPYKHFSLTPIEIIDIKNNKYLLKIHGYKKAKVYVWLFIFKDNQMYVGRSVNLYARIRSYFYRIPK